MISVIIPVYNVEDYLRQCIDSVLAQTFTDIEVILVDDGSTDSSGDICREYATGDARIRLIHKANRGLSSARNAGLEIARGSHVYFIDSDDLMTADCLERLEQARRETGSDIVCGGYTHEPRELGSGKGRLTVPSHEAIDITLHQRPGILNTAWGKLYPRQIFDELRFTEGIWYEDLDIFYRLYERVKTVTWLGVKMYLYRLHDSNFTSRWTPRRLDVLEVMERMERWAEEEAPQHLEAVHDRHFAAACNMFLLLSRNEPKHPARSHCWELVRRYRRGLITARGVRLKNRLGAVLSYLGPRVFALFA